MPETKRWAIIVHGGAKPMQPEKEDANRRGCLTALEAGRAVLERGGSAVDAVEAAIRALEDDPTFNAGYGAVPNSDGNVELDAAIMDGTNLNIGGVAGLTHVRNPISVAKLLLDREQVLLTGDGARRFAREQGVELCDPADLLTPEHQDSNHDTVGCVALDVHGNLAAGASTGGLTDQPPGRIGDSPLPGCGFYADNTLGGAAVSGDGERIARVLLAKHALDLTRDHNPDQAIETAVRRMARRVGGEAGVILIDPEGNVGWSHNSSHFAVAWQTSSMTGPTAEVRKNSSLPNQQGTDNDAKA